MTNSHPAQCKWRNLVALSAERHGFNFALASRVFKPRPEMKGLEGLKRLGVAVLGFGGF